MLNKMKRLTKFSLLLLFVGLLTSCSIERRLAQRYVKDTKPGAVLLIAPDFIWKTSFKVPEMENFDQLEQWEKDSVAFENSSVLKHSADSLYIDSFMSSLKYGLSVMGYTVYYDNPETFLDSEYKPSHIINFVQMQLEEYYEPINEEADYDDTTSAEFEIYVTAINMNHWLELSELNNGDDKPDLLFNTHIIYDDLYGEFRYFPLTGGYIYVYSVDSLNTDKLYLAASNQGLLYAKWIYDYMMNDYIIKNMPDGRLPEYRYSYDMQYRWITKQKFDPFIKMD